MIKRLVLTALMLGSFNIGTILAADSPNLDEVNLDIATIESSRAKIASLERSLNNLRIDSRAGMWNFLGRSNNEKTIQKRSQIMREISSVKSGINSISLKLIDARAGLRQLLDKDPSNAGLRQALAYLDRLAVDEALAAAEFMAASDVGPAGLSNDRAEILRYRLQTQAQTIKNVETLMAVLKTVRKGCEEAKLSDLVQVYDKYIQELGDKQAEGLKSQDAIRNALK